MTITRQSTCTSGLPPGEAQRGERHHGQGEEDQGPHLRPVGGDALALEVGNAQQVLALFQNLLGLAAGPFITGVLSDALGLETALTIIPAFGLLAALFFVLATRSYEADIQRVRGVPVAVDTGIAGPAAGRAPA